MSNRKFCEYQFIMGNKKGQICGKFLKKGENYCYLHKKFYKDVKKMEEVKPEVLPKIEAKVEPKIEPEVKEIQKKKPVKSLPKVKHVKSTTYLNLQQRKNQRRSLLKLWQNQKLRNQK